MAYSLKDRDCSEVASGHAHSASYALVRIDYVRLAHGSHDGRGRAVLGAQSAAFALGRVYRVCQEGLALLGAALAVLHVLYIFVIEIIDSGENRVRGSLPESAKSGVLDDGSQVFQSLQVSHFPVAFGDPGQYLKHPFVADPARSAFPAGFANRKFQIEFSD